MMRVDRRALVVVLACSFGFVSGCGSSDTGGTSEWEVGEDPDDSDGEGDDISLRACCSRHNLTDSRCEEIAGEGNNLPVGDNCAGNRGCTQFPSDNRCGCRCTVCHDETCLRGLCVDGPGCTSDVGVGGD